MNEDLSSLVAGSIVVVCSGYSGRTFHIDAVERVTPTQAIVGGERFRRSDGLAVGDRGWNAPCISIEPHLFMKAREQRAERGLRDTFPLTQAGVIKARAAADYAEKFLRATGKWDDKTEEPAA